MNQESGPPTAPGSIIASGRYSMLGELGSGGMATVHRVVDLASGVEVALKRLRPQADVEARNRGIAHLEREFHTLSQLAHPRVVSVFDYGVDGGDPYYTMELLDGGDLQERTPLAWRTACAVARDVCSALSLMHSRRLVHRDLSPRNVRCTSDGRAKLIDFGAMVPMGPSKSVVGTPAICAPELVRLQPLDGRTDLYALGATLYFTLTGRFPYPARTFAHLESLWKHRPQLPSQIVAEIPEALDRLVMDLLQLETGLRPFSASEVMQRLSAIADLPLDEQLLVPQAYLATPNLVARDAPVARMRRYAAGLLRGRGRAVLIEGQPGVGRTRFLDACSLEGKLVGATVVRADGSDAAAGDFGVARALGRRLLETATELATEAAKPYWEVLARHIPELAARGSSPLQPSAARSNAPELHPDAAQFQNAVREWFLAASRQRPLCLVVDDLHRVDEPSAALLALLAKECRGQRLLLVASMQRDQVAGSLATRMFADASTGIGLLPLTQAETERLLRSVFGDVPNVQLLTTKLFAISEGRPRDLMQLAQHLVDREVVRYAAGAWSLPAQIDTADLPASLADALVARVRALDAGARALGQAMALSGEQLLSLEECAVVLDRTDLSQVRSWLDELVLAGVIVPGADRFAVGPQGWHSALMSTIEPTLEPKLREGLARVFTQRGLGFLSAMHTLESGAIDRGLDLLIAHAEASLKVTHTDSTAFFALLRSLPKNWISVYERAIELCVKLGRPERERLVLQRRVVGLANCDASCGATVDHFTAPFEALARCCGLDIYAGLDPALDPQTRLHMALAQAKQRHDSLPERERVLEPRAAAVQLARVVLTCVGQASTSLDFALLERLPSLDPLAPLSPSMALMQSLVEASRARLAGRFEEAHERYEALLDRLGGAEAASLDETNRHTAMLGISWALANIDAAMGLDSCLEWVDHIASHPLHEVNAQHGRGLYHLWRGDPETADRLRSEAELLTVQRQRVGALEGTHLVRVVAAHAISDDLTRLKQSMDDVEPLARRYAAWQSVLCYARAEHARIRGDFASALQEIEQALGVMRAGEDQLWAFAAAAHARILSGLGRHAEAQARAEEHLQAASTADLGYVKNYIRMALAVATAHMGEMHLAAHHADQVLTEFRNMGSQGLNVALAHETRVQVAVLAGDRASAETHLNELATELRFGSNQTFNARYERLRSMSRRTFLGDSRPAQDEPVMRTQIIAALTGCEGTEERAQRSLEILLAETGSTQGFLYAITSDGCTLAASRADHALPAEIDAIARKSLAQELHDDANTGEIEDSDALTRAWSTGDGRTYRSVLLGHSSKRGFVVTGLGVLLCDPNVPLKDVTQIATEISRYAGLQRESPRLSLAP